MKGVLSRESTPSTLGPFLRDNAFYLGALCASIILAHLFHFIMGVSPKYWPFATVFENFQAGQYWVHGTSLSVTRLSVGGPLYFLMHYPLVYLRTPIYSLDILYLLLELASLALWLVYGRRFFEDRVVLITAFFLAISEMAKTEIGESSLFLQVLPLLILLTFLSALRSRRAVAFFLPALLWGVALQFHITALFIAPALVLAIWHQGQRRSPRLFITLGTLLIFGALPTFIGMSFQGDDHLSMTEWVVYINKHRDLGQVLLTALVLVVYNIFAIVGAWRLLGRSPRSTTSVLVGLWFIVPLLLIPLADPDEYKPWHYTILGPAKFLLSAVGVILLRQKIRDASRLGRLIHRFGTLRSVAIILLAISLLGPGLDLLHIHVSNKQAQHTAVPCITFHRNQRPAIFLGILNSVKARYLQDEHSLVRFTGVSHDHLAGALYWETGAAYLYGNASTRSRRVHNVFVGCRFDAIKALPAQRQIYQWHSSAVVDATQVENLRYEKRGQAITSEPFPAPDASARYAVLHLEGDLGFAVQKILLRAGARVLRPLQSCTCSRWGAFGAQYVFDLGVPAGRAQEYALELSFSGALVYLGEVVFL